MVRSAFVLAALLVPAPLLAQAVTTTSQGPDGRDVTITTTRPLDGLNSIEVRPAQGGGIVTGGGPPGAPPRDTPAATGTSVIRGRIVDAASGAPLRKATVRIFGAAIRESRSTSTDADGRYAFTDLPAGQFNLNADKTGYVSFGYGQTAPFEMGKPLKVGEKQTVEKIDFSLPRGAVITGRVLDEYGEPVADVQVAALRNQFTPTGPRPTPAGRSGSTNDIGEFRLFGLPPGQYMISATYRSQSFNSPSDDGNGYALTYYPGTANVGEAQKIPIGTGGSVSDVTLMLATTRTAKISGVVLDSQGRPSRQGGVMLTPRNGSIGATMSGGAVRPDGTFTINGVPPGDYILRGTTSGPPQPGMPMEIATANVSVNGVDVTDVRVEPVKPITVAGHVVLDPVAARSFKPETVRLTATANDNGPLFGPPPPPAAVRDDFTFEFKTNPGAATVRVAGTGWMIKSATLDGADVTDVITFKNEDITGLEVELTNKLPDVSGLVTDGKGDAIADYYAIVFPQEQERWNAPGPNRTAMTRPDDQGRFRIRTLRPGNYYVVAVDHVQTGQWMDPAFMEAVHTYATRITVNDGDTQVLDLKLVQMR